MIKKLLVTIAIILFSFNAFAFTLTLPEPLTPPTATKLEVLKIQINENQKSLFVYYRFLSDTNEEIYVASGKTGTRMWACQDLDAVEGGAPASTCFTDTFSFVIRNQDVGKKIGTGLWQLIWSKMKPDVLKVSGNDIN